MKVQASISAVAALAASFSIGWPQLSESAPPRLPGTFLSGLTAHEINLIQTGRERFLDIADLTRGLGPAYNGTVVYGPNLGIHLEGINDVV